MSLFRPFLFALFLFLSASSNASFFPETAHETMAEQNKPNVWNESFWGEETFSKTPLENTSNQNENFSKKIMEEESFETSWLFFDRAKSKRKKEEALSSPLPLWLKNAVAIKDVPKEAPMIAIVIDDLGF